MRHFIVKGNGSTVMTVDTRRQMCCYMDLKLTEVFRDALVHGPFSAMNRDEAFSDSCTMSSIPFSHFVHKHACGCCPA